MQNCGWRILQEIIVQINREERVIEGGVIVRKQKDKKGRKGKEKENLIQKKNYLVIGLYLVTHKISIFCSNWGFFM